MSDSVGKCNICKDVYTSTSIEMESEFAIFICADCIEQTKDNFIWLCITCGNVYIKPKYLVINKVKDLAIKKAYMLCEEMQMIQGIDMCIACHPERIIEFMETQYAGVDC